MKVYSDFATMASDLVPLPPAPPQPPPLWCGETARLFAALRRGEREVLPLLCDALEEAGRQREAHYYRDYARQWALIPALLDEASEGCPGDTGYYPGAYRLRAARYYAGVASCPEEDGTGPAAWRDMIIGGFAHACRREGVTCRAVLYWIAIPTVPHDGDAPGVFWGLYGI